MPTINTIAEAGFTRGVDAYEKARPDYPMDAIAHIIAELELGRSSVIADVGAGTGKFTQALLPTGAKVYAVEPLDAMREKLDLPGVVPVRASAESVPLPDKSLDAITVAQAFHWFDGPRAVHEFSRLLKPTGGVALLWNQRDLRVPWIAEVEKLIKPYENIQPHDKLHETVSPFNPRLGFTLPVEREFSHVQQLDHDGVVTRVASISYIATLDAQTQASLFARIRATIAELPTHIDFVYRTRVYTTQRL